MDQFLKAYTAATRARLGSFCCAECINAGYDEAASGCPHSELTQTINSPDYAVYFAKTWNERAQ